MFTKYFEDVQKQLVKARPGSQSKTRARGKTASKSGKTAPAAAQLDPGGLIKIMEGLVPPKLCLGTLGVIDPSGYSPEGVDFVAYRPLCRDMAALMGGYAPSELVYGTYHLCGDIGRENLQAALNSVVQAKKLNLFTEDRQEYPAIPAFIVSAGGGMRLEEIKESILDYYVSKSVDYALEFDVLMILDKGLVVKNWREKRSFIALETGAATLMWFFILMHEYLDIERGGSLDLRNYVKYTEKYAEY
ncbi:MAG TPA: hypothetical protein PKO25_01425 [Spirochaetota bacterium]|jgi:hypothetical protein|nr:hypothetical protein [Spirochaetota bacterium]OPZ39417.1 MAG: hypothetical protein BWY96_00248 [Spirochaetes bacterium ADurb.BinA120]HNU90515.1 hypothetical protein [Spirochaetota bacterium]HPI13427.1 hypothetical protein [Spirochaetota bacterium]HPV96491.1 hypothetical protein [Spirochaetota bacterium]